MSDYIVTTNFGAKDSLPSGNAGKIIKGSEFTTEFNNIATAIASKVDNNQVLTNVPANAIFTANDFTDEDHTKLSGIETGATADQTNAEIRAAVEAASDSNVFTNADHAKLNNIEGSADVTDTANVVAALTAGTNITINNNGTISSTNTTYTAGTGITLTDTVFSANGSAITGVNAAQVDGKSISVVTSMPASPDSNTIYFVTG